MYFTKVQKQRRTSSCSHPLEGKLNKKFKLVQNQINIPIVTQFANIYFLFKGNNNLVGKQSAYVRLSMVIETNLDPILYAQFPSP